MKKINQTIILLFSLIIFSCGGEKTTNESVAEVTKQEVDQEKKWETFTIRGVGNTMMEMKYDIESIVVKEGSWVRITLINEGIDIAMQHNIVFIKYGTRKEIAMQAIEAGRDMKYVPKNSNVIASSDLAMPGDTVVLEFKAPNKGNYEYLCTYPGHAEIMRGYFFVK
tara:strand:+ start:29 stop:529 length:501 start_codon:yes stop_codon:yes gene_type:complete